MGVFPKSHVDYEKSPCSISIFLQSLLLTLNLRNIPCHAIHFVLLCSLCCVLRVNFKERPCRCVKFRGQEPLMSRERREKCQKAGGHWLHYVQGERWPQHVLMSGDFI